MRFSWGCCTTLIACNYTKQEMLHLSMSLPNGRSATARAQLVQYVMRTCA